MTRETLNLTYAGKCATGLLLNPRRFFSEEGQRAHWALAFGFVLISAFISSGAGLLLTRPLSPLLTGSILFVNAVGMVLISTGFAYLVVWLIRGERIRFEKLFSIYAFAGSMPLLLSWVPGAFWITELWKWWLVGTGLTRSTNFRGTQVAMIMGCSIGLTILFFWSLMLII